MSPSDFFESIKFFNDFRFLGTNALCSSSVNPKVLICLNILSWIIFPESRFPHVSQSSFLNFSLIIDLAYRNRISDTCLMSIFAPRSKRVAPKYVEQNVCRCPSHSGLNCSCSSSDFDK